MRERSMGVAWSSIQFKNFTKAFVYNELERIKNIHRNTSQEAHTLGGVVVWPMVLVVEKKKKEEFNVYDGGKDSVA